MFGNFGTLAPAIRQSVRQTLRGSTLKGPALINPFKIRMTTRYSARAPLPVVQQWWTQAWSNR